jgi:ribosome-binding protein aMBF1 (putative translation factor)
MPKTDKPLAWLHGEIRTPLQYDPYRSRSMSTAKLKRLQSAGWKSGSSKDFLRLSNEDAMLVELKVSLTVAVRQSRQKRGLSQIDLARRIGSSQSHVAKMEAGDPSVSLDLIVRAFFASGGTRQELQRAFGAKVKLAA